MKRNGIDPAPERGKRMAVVHNDRGSVMQFTCSFHSWRYGLDGQCTHVTDRDTFREGALCDNIRMREVRCERRAGLIFINLDDDAPPFVFR